MPNRSGVRHGTACRPAAEDYAAAGRSLRVMECLVKFGGDVSMIGTQNVDVMTREIYALDAAIAERKTAVKTDEVNVAEIFSKPEAAGRGRTGKKPRYRNRQSEPAPMRMRSMGSCNRISEAATGNPASVKRFGNPAKRHTGSYPAIRQLPVEGYSGDFAGYERANHSL